LERLGAEQERERESWREERARKGAERTTIFGHSITGK
jgi:hypothetical protein